MSRSLNKVMLIGNLGQDPEIRTTTSGARVAQFSLATSRSWTGRDGQNQEKTEWHRIVVWENTKQTGGGLFGVVERFLHKGKQVYVEGEIEYRQYEDKDGVTKYSTEIRARDIMLLSRGEGERGDYGGGSRAAAGAGAASGARAGGAGGGRAGGGGSYDDFQAPPFEDDDDLPF